MIYAIQVLLHQGSSALYVGYKVKRMLLFICREDGTYRVWKVKAANFDYSLLSDDERVVAVIDPPERGRYVSEGGCRSLIVAFNDWEKHLKNFSKDGIVLVTSMCTKQEVLAMVPVLYNPRKTPHPWQESKLNTPEEREAEIEKRIDLVGPIIRFVFDSDLFQEAITERLNTAGNAAVDVLDSNLHKALRGIYTPLIGRLSAFVSSRLFLLNPEPIYHIT